MRDDFSYFSLKPYVVTPHLNCLTETYVVTPYLNHLLETVQMRGHNLGFCVELTKIIPYITKYSLSSRALVVFCVFIILPLLSVVVQYSNPPICMSALWAKTLEPRCNTVRYNTNSDITRMRVGPTFLPNLPLSYLLNISMFSKRVNTVIKTVNYFTLTLSQLSKLSLPCLSPSFLR